MMLLLQVFVGVLTVLLFLFTQNFVFAGFPPVKRDSTIKRAQCLCGESPLETISEPSRACAGLKSRAAFIIELAMPKYKKDPKIQVDNEDIDCRPVD